MTDLSEWMEEDLNTGFQFPLGTLGPTHSLVQCLPTGVHIIMMTDLACEHVTDTLFVTYCCTKIQILFLISYRWIKKATANKMTDVQLKVLATEWGIR